MSVQRASTRATSTLLRISVPIFLRVFSARAGPVVFSLFAIYVTSFIASFLTQPKVEAVADEVDVVARRAVLTPNHNHAGHGDDESDEDEDDEDDDDEEEDSEDEEDEDEDEDDQDSDREDTEDHVVVEEIVAKETITLSEKDVSSWNVLLSGVPSPKRLAASIVTFCINLVLVGLVADYVFLGRFYPAEDLSFVRLGYLSHNEARFLVREPDQAKMPVVFEIRLKGAVEPAESSIWQAAGSIFETTNKTDFTGVAMIPLKHMDERRYEWRTSNNHSGEFLTPPQPGRMPSYNDGKFTFLSTSCILPRFPYSPTEHPLAIPGLRHLARRLPELKAQFMLFLGDFIYIDVPQRFGEASNPSEYKLKYRQVYASPDWPSVGQNLSWIHVLDDHEISNVYYSSSNETSVYKAAVEPWHIYQAAANPPKAVMAGTKDKSRQHATWYEFVQGPASFFMLDTRSFRSDNNLPYEGVDKTMLGPEQLDDFLAWLARPEAHGVRWKIVASSVPFTKNWPVNLSDTWGGFLVERRKVLEAMWDTSTRGYGVVILSGDRHEFAATKFPPPPESRWPESASVLEFSTSPLNQFASPFPSYGPADDEDVMLKYLHSGNSKFGSFTFENKGGESTLLYRLFIAGEEAWNFTVTAPPVSATLRPTGSFMGMIKDYLEKALQ